MEHLPRSRPRRRPKGHPNMESEPERSGDSQRQFATRFPNTPKAILNMQPRAKHRVASKGIPIWRAGLQPASPTPRRQFSICSLGDHLCCAGFPRSQVRKFPQTNFQISSNIQIPKTKLRTRVFVILSLVLRFALEIGLWKFGRARLQRRV
jgi:hypothetical protein